MRLSDVKAAVDSGADAVGFVVASLSSRRNLSMSAARNLMQDVPVFASKVAVTSNGDSRILSRICARLEPDALQLHRSIRQTVRTIRKLHPEVDLIIATSVHGDSAVAQAKRASLISDAVLADSLGPDGMGGTGRTHDWTLTAKIREEIFPHPMILAGGLTPTNVHLAINTVKPYAVDVSSGVEARPGIKDPAKIRNFIKNAKETKV